MKILFLSGLLLASTLATGCSFEQTSERLSPTAPSGNENTAGGTAIGGSSTSGGSTSAGGSTTTGGSGFSGAWGSSTIAGLPLGNCSDVNWQINSQTDTSITGSVSANCSSGVVVAANLTGTLQGADAFNLTAEGTLTVLGLPCQFKLTGVGTRQGGDAIKVDYTGTYCFGTASGSETLRRPQTKPTVVLEPPSLVSPSNGVTLSGIVPQFTLKAGNRSGVTGPIEYILEVSNDASFTSIAARFFQAETLPDTTIAPDYSFLNSRTYYWRARTGHGRGADLSDWSQTRTFKTPVPADAGGGGGGDTGASNTGGGSTSGGGGTNPAACNSSKGSDIANCIEARYPQYRRAGVSLDQRKRDMQFLRDRLIEHATCKGLTVGLNLKRGGPEISNDFITFFTLGRWVGVDIASGYDDTRSALSMMWYQHGASTNWGYPYHKPYGPVNCN
jgi:hypothetical protein